MATTLTPPVFIDNNPAQILADCTSQFEALLQGAPWNLTGYTVQPGDPAYALIQMLAYEESKLIASINSAGLDGLVDFSNAPILDFLAANRNVTRLVASPSVTSVLFNLVPGHGTLTIPAGLRVGSSDGQQVFATDVDTVVLSTINAIVISCTNVVTGLAGNGYAIGAVNAILDPQAYLTSVSNTDATSGGADTESDDALRVRVKLANSTYSVAGSEDAYRYWALTADPAIIDVSVISNYSGEADIYVLTNSLMTTTQPVLDEVNAILSPQAIRPLCDTVMVYSANQISYALVCNLTLIQGSSSADIIAQVTPLLQAYTDAQSRTIGADVVLDTLKALCQVTNVYGSDFGAFAGLVVDDTSFAVCGSITVNVVAYVTG